MALYEHYIIVLFRYMWVDKVMVIRERFAFLSNSLDLNAKYFYELLDAFQSGSRDST